ncbi:MAG: gliding motility-associated C-terminal domain-containing protein [Cytophaga sp.]|uniref:T9SS type B sorting domain-containing protein n=1 Tax=Cytophaga sp. TaxID=29535 RepID=UPI003F7F028E
MVRLFYTLLLFLLTLSIQAQSTKRANIWYVSQGVGYDFNCTPPCPIENGALPKSFCSSSICDKTGKLLLYTNSENIWNNKHQIIPNGSDLYACRWAEQSSVFIPFASDPNLYYLVTVDDTREPLISSNPYTCKDVNPITYSMCLHLIDVAANNGTGQVVWKNKVIYGGNVRINDMLGAVKHANAKDTWLMTYDYNIKRFVSLLLTDCGVQDTVISPDLGAYVREGPNTLTFSPKGDLFYVNTREMPPHGGFMIARFNDTTGIASKPLLIENLLSTTGCFSTDSKKLYTTQIVVGFDLSIWDSTAISDSRQGLDSIGNNFIQNGPDGNIHAMYFLYKSMHLLTIHNPMSTPIITKTQFTVKKPVDDLQSTGIPNFVQNWFDPDFNEYTYGSPKIHYTRVCKGEKTIFKSSGMPPATPYHWEIIQPNQPVVRFDNQDSIAYTFIQSGVFTVKLSIDFSCMPDVITRNDIIVDSLPEDYLQDLYICEGSVPTLQAQPNQLSYLWNTGNTSPQQSAESDNAYYVDVTNTCGIIRDEVNVHEVHYVIPNLITPNNDFKNDIFKIDSNNPVQGNLEIYNSWGVNIYKNNFYKNTWPENDIESGVYYYRFTYSTCVPSKGWLQVIK